MGSVYSKSTTTERKTNLGRVVWVCGGGRRRRSKEEAVGPNGDKHEAAKAVERWKPGVEKVVAQLQFTSHHCESCGM